MTSPLSCPCGSGQTYKDCCERYVQGTEPAPTAEALMRSRYSAYALAEEVYLLDTWHHTTRPPQLGLADASAARWIGLKIIQSQAGQEQDTDGSVEFVARYKVNGKAERLHENSRFTRDNGRWFYIDGEQIK